MRRGRKFVEFAFATRRRSPALKARETNDELRTGWRILARIWTREMNFCESDSARSRIKTREQKSRISRVSVRSKLCATTRNTHIYNIHVRIFSRWVARSTESNDRGRRERGDSARPDGGCRNDAQQWTTVQRAPRRDAPAAAAVAAHGYVPSMKESKRNNCISGPGGQCSTTERPSDRTPRSCFLTQLPRRAARHAETALAPTAPRTRTASPYGRSFAKP